MGRLSAVVITRNEERNIQRCLDSLQDVVDEVIIVDSGSTDRTEEICARYPMVRFFRHAWLGYGATKNFANSLAECNYILSLDADEALSSELKKSLAEPIQLSGVYRVRRRTNYCGQWIWHTGWYPDEKIRIFPKAAAQWSEDAVHEELKVNQNLPIHELNGDLLHYSYYTIQEHLLRTDRYSQLAAAQIAVSKKTFLRTRAVLNSVLRFFKHYFLKRGDRKSVV